MSSFKQRFTKCVLGLFLALFLVPGMVMADHINAVPYTNWSLSLDGGANMLTVPSYLTISGMGYIENTPTATGFDFVEWAAFQALANNFGQTIQDEFGPYQLTGDLTGFGTVDAGGGSFTFEGGALDLYVSTPRVYGDTSENFYGVTAGTKIASFDLVMGGGFVNPDTTPTGFVSTELISNFLLPGYFFAPDGTDIAELVGGNIQWFFALTNTSASYITGDAIDPLFTAALLDTFGIVAEDSAPLSFFIANSGEFTIGTVVPEPGTILLLGAGLLGLAGIGRRKIRMN